MKRGCVLLVTLLVWTLAGTAQTPEKDLYYPYAEPEERALLPHSDSALFFRAIRLQQDLFDLHTRFALPRVSYARRGESYRAERASLYGIEVPYGAWSLLRALGAEEHIVAGAAMQPMSVGGSGGQRAFSFTDALPLQPYRVSLRYAERNYRVGAQATWDAEIGNGWHGAWAIDYRTGRDSRIEGVFTDALQLGGRMIKRWKSGRELTVVATVPLSMRGLRGAATAEAFQLTDDPYYNPSWGFQGGEVRNSRVRREVLPMVVATLQSPLTERSLLRVTAGAELGLRKQSGLGWYDARTPQPDHYRKMPSYTLDLESESVWREADPRYTQVAWDELIAINRMGDGSAVYTLEDRVQRLTRMQMRLAMETRSGATTFDYGLFASHEQNRYYKQMRDLLGADYLIDIDQYLIDDDAYSNRLQNDLRHPSREVGKGDRFAYDYALIRNALGGWLKARVEKDRWQAEAAMELINETVYRKGYYEKELFAGVGSFGSSRKIRRMPYTLKAAAGYSFSPRSFLGAQIAYGTQLTEAEHLFIQPLYNNRTIENPALSSFFVADLRYRQQSERLDWQLAAFLHLHRDGLQTQRYFDDLAGVYADMTLSRLATRAYGIEAAASWRMAYRWTLMAAASWVDCRYVEDAVIDVVADTDNRVVDRAAVSCLRACRPGGVPSLTASVAMRYYGPHGWSVRLSGGVAADRYVDPAALRRTDRVAYQAGTTPEGFDAYTHQERLDNAFTLDLSVFKTFYFENDTQLWLSLHLNNLSGSEVPAYGYESMRSQRQGGTAASLYLPQATRYRYTDPRSLMLTIGYRF